MMQEVVQGDALEVLRMYPDGYFNCIITSPPYWGLRDYGVDGQLGLEPTFQEYIARLIEIFNEAKRVLTKDGTCWVNLGDTYAGGGGWTGVPDDWRSVSTASKQQRFDHDKKHIQGVKAKSLCQIPSRFAIAMTDNGWILRNEIIWYKRNCMPSSAKDRFTVDFEKIFFFTKNKKYWFEQQKESTVTYDTCIRARDITKLNNTPGRTKMGGLKTNQYTERNKRCVWDIPTKPYKEAHFAVFPDTLVEPMLSAGCPPDGWVCDPFCGSGTVGLVAKRQNKNFIGIELNREYIELAERRIME